MRLTASSDRAGPAVARKAGWLLLLLALGGCQPSNNSKSIPPTAAAPSAGPTTAIRYDRLPESAGLTFAYRNGEEAGHYAILESLGGGVALLDYDGDGRLDICLAGGGGFDAAGQPRGRPPGMFRQVDGNKYVDVTREIGLAESSLYTHAAVAADVDNDGDPDLLFTGYGGVRLYRNDGGQRFADVTAASRLDQAGGWFSSAAFADFNRDGWLDLYLVRYVDWSPTNHPACRDGQGRPDVCSPRQFQPLPDALLLATGKGTFVEQSEVWGLRRDGKGLGVVAADFDLDGWIDLYVANDTVPNFLYRNPGTGRFEELGSGSGTAVNDRGLPDGSMGVDVGDIDGDGLPDLWVANYENESYALYRNAGGFLFQHASQRMGVTAVGQLAVGWGTAFLDADNDGDEDLFAANGHVIRHPTAAPVRQPPFLFENQTISEPSGYSGPLLVNVAAAVGPYLREPHPARGLAVGDLNNDGRLDLVISQVNEPAAALLNQSPPRAWLGIKLVGRRSNRDAVGARVELHTAHGVQSRQRKGGGSYASSSDPRLHFGLGAATAVTKLVIHWPSGTVQELPNPPLREWLTITEPDP